MIERNGGRIRKRLTKVISNFFEGSWDIAVCEGELMMICGILLGHSTSIRQFGEALFIEASRIRFDRTTRKLRHKCHNDARVDAAAQMCAERTFAKQAHFDSLAEASA